MVVGPILVIMAVKAGRFFWVAKIHHLLLLLPQLYFLYFATRRLDLVKIPWKEQTTR